MCVSPIAPKTAYAAARNMSETSSLKVSVMLPTNTR